MAEGARASAAAGELACGIDVVDLDAFDAVVELRGESFLSRVFTDHEQHDCKGNTARLAARFAAKESVAKALGTGLTETRLRDVEICLDERGKPFLHLTGEVAARAHELGLSTWSVSISHSARVASAMVVAGGASEQSLPGTGMKEAV
ncbi:MAG: holo-ACP synthase [Actinomycetota bacterium]